MKLAGQAITQETKEKSTQWKPSLLGIKKMLSVNLTKLLNSFVSINIINEVNYYAPGTIKVI